jgi:aerobic carbon-monoxide dehydrogenase medium subunit
MKPASFDYHAPTSVDDALSLLKSHSGDARLLAGGQSLLPMMNFRLATPTVVVDLNRIPGLAYIERDSGIVRIGAMTRQRAIEFSPVVASDLPLLREAIKFVGHLPTRSRGTIGGSIANADPSAEIPMVLQVLEGEVHVRGPQGERSIAADELFLDMMTTSLAREEMLTEVRLPVMPPGAGFAVEEFARRRGDFAIAAVAVVILRDGNHCRRARIATAGISSHASRLRAAEQVLEEDGLTDNAIAEAAKVAVRNLEPLSDNNASAEFRRHLTSVLTERALQRAAGNAMKGD